MVVNWLSNVDEIKSVQSFQYNMLQRLYRLPAGIRLQHPSSLSTIVFIAKFASNGLDHARYAFVVSKKVHTLAVERNSFKRRFRACLESMQCNMKPGYDVVFILKKEALPFSADQFTASLEELKKRLT